MIIYDQLWLSFPLQIACLKVTYHCLLLSALFLQGLGPQVPSKYQQITEQAQYHMQIIGSVVEKSCGSVLSKMQTLKKRSMR